MDSFSEIFIRKRQDQLNTDFTKLLLDRDAQNRRYTNMLHQIRNVCVEFTNVLLSMMTLPLNMNTVDSSSKATKLIQLIWISLPWL
jgi:hypothetical protein